MFAFSFDMQSDSLSFLFESLLKVYEIVHLMYHRISSGFLVKSLFILSFMSWSMTSKPQHKETILAIIMIIKILLIKLFVRKLVNINNSRQTIDSFMLILGLSKLCSLYRKYILYIGIYCKIISLVVYFVSSSLIFMFLSHDILVFVSTHIVPVDSKIARVIIRISDIVLLVVV
jgi:hypothetical protein